MVKLIESFKADYPSYYQKKYQENSTSLAQLEQLLSRTGSTFIEYFWQENTIYLLLTNGKERALLKIPVDFPLDQWIERLQVNIRNQSSAFDWSQDQYVQQADAFVTLSSQLYTKLFKPIEESFPLSEKVVLVPDGKIAYIPFDGLVKEQAANTTQFKAHQYLLSAYEVSYTFSGTVLQKLKERSPKSKWNGTFLGFAPTFNSVQMGNTIAQSDQHLRSILGPLKYNVPEVKAIGGLYEGDLWVGENASKEKFLNEAPNYQIIHLATHGKADQVVGDHAFLAFESEKENMSNQLFYNWEIYNLQFNAEMVVLSACETGIGEWQEGEGVISLARGFSYAGAQSVITSLWAVNDASTKNLMVYFYEKLQEGYSKASALRAAKLAFIQQQDHTHAHPFYWAGFVPIGNMDPISGKGAGGWWPWLLTMLVLSVVAYWIYSRR